MTLPPAPTFGTLVVRESRVVYASAGAAVVMGRHPRDLMGRVFFEFLVPEERARITDRYARRLRGEPVPSEYEMVLELPGGGRRTVEAFVSLEGRDEVVVRLRDLSDQAERRGRLLGLAELGVSIQREQTAAAVHQRVQEGLLDLGLASLLVRPGPDGAQVLWARLPGPVRQEVEARLGAPAIGYRGSITPLIRLALDEGAGFADDFFDQMAAFLPPELREAARGLTRAEGRVRGLAVRLEERTGPGDCLVVVGVWLRPVDLGPFRLFASQVVAALDSARAIAELSDRNFDLAALNRLGELAGGAVGLAEFLPAACRLVQATLSCRSVSVFAADHATRRLVLAHAADAPAEVLAALGDVTFDGPLGAMLGQRRPLVTRVEALDEPYRALLAAAGLVTFAFVPLAVRSRVFGVMVTAWGDRREEEACRPDLLHAVGSHFAAAMESDHLLGDLRRRVGELTLLNDVAGDIGALDPARLLENALRRMCATLEADGALAFLVEDGGLARLAAIGLSPASLALTARLEPGEGPAGLSMTRLQPVLEASEEESGPRCWAARVQEGYQALVAVPLIAKGRAVGALCLGRRAARPFAPGEVALLSALGAQLGVAVDAARHHADTQRRAADLETLSALALRFIAGPPGDVPGILEAACAEVQQALRASQVVVMLLDAAGEHLEAAASAGLPVPEPVRRIPLAQAGLGTEALLTGAPRTTEDTVRDPRSLVFGRPDVPAMALLAIPIASRTRKRGVVFVADAAGRRFGPADLALAIALGGELAMALESAELHDEARRRAEELALLQDVGRSLVETLQLDQVLTSGVRDLARMVDAPAAQLLLLDEAAGELVVRAVSGPGQAPLGRRLPHRSAGGAAARCLEERRPVLLTEATDAPEPLRALSGLGSGLVLPLLVRDKTIGVALIAEHGGARRFSAAEVQRATAVANQLAVAVDNARAHARALTALADLQHAQQKLLRQERLAALGELAAVVAHEVRNPLGVIFNSLGTLRRLVGPAGAAAPLLDMVGEEADRLNRIVGDLLDFARPATPELRPEPLERVVEEVLAAALDRLPAPLEVARAYQPGLPPVPLDARQARQALLNVALNAVQAMPRGGRLAVRTRVEGGQAVVELEDSGPGMPAEVRDRIFEPFFTTKATGTGLGLAVVKRIMDGHGGEVSVRTEEGRGTTVALRFPLGGPGSVELPGGMG